ncbi:MAG TPA: GTPase Era [Cyclobacteriaceae bacterium]
MTEEAENHKAGFISIIGRPNVGKSTLMNSLVGEKLSIITSKAQTTRHRLFGIISGENYQMVYSDTPGYLNPAYKLQESMLSYVNTAIDDADLILWVVELKEKMIVSEITEKIINAPTHKLLVINKMDQSKGSQLHDKTLYWKALVPDIKIIPTSAIENTNTDLLFDEILTLLPIHPAYFPKDSLTDKAERFFAAEIIREKIFLNYEEEIPYSCEVVITDFKEEENLISIRAEIYVERQSQKGIIIGKGGGALKKVGQEARVDMETFFDKKVFLETYVKVEADWRKKDSKLKKFGYQQ